MFTSLSISRYRGFRSLAVERLGRVNLVAGPNNAGKTSLLEAVFLLAHGGSAQAALNGHVVRAVTPAANALVMWGSLFADLDTSDPIAVHGTHRRLGSLRLAIEHRHSATVQTVPSNRDSRPTVHGSPELHFSLAQELPDGTPGRAVRSQISVGASGGEVKGEGDPLVVQCVFLTSCAEHPELDAQRLGELRRRKEAELVVEALQAIEPGLRGLDAISGPGGHSLYGDIGLSEQVPLITLGDGLNRLARLVLAMAHARGLVVLVDEIENGFHHSVLDGVWKVIYATAERFDTQLIATTHSYEAISAAYRASVGHELVLHRLEPGEDGVSCVTYDADSIEGAVEHGLEVR